MKILQKLNQQLQSTPDVDFAVQVDVAQQLCYLFDRAGDVYKRYPISTASNGVCATENSGGTPPGLHVISDCIGTNEPLGMQFKGREPVGNIAPIIESTPKKTPVGDFILSRIMWLKGLEQGINLGDGVDSHQRYIYFHGTNEEYLIGSPASHGCIRMRNEDIIELYDLVGCNTPVLIG